MFYPGGCGCSAFYHVDPTEASPGRAGKLRIPDDSGVKRRRRAMAEDVLKRLPKVGTLGTPTLDMLHGRAEIARLILAKNLRYAALFFVIAQHR